MTTPANLSSKQVPNTLIWDKIYETGSMLWYPSEALVRMVRRHERDFGMSGVVLDHGCGSGNVAEFLIRSGYDVHCTEVSPAALKILEARFNDSGLKSPVSSLIDPLLDLAGQLPKFDHAVAWQSLCYCSYPVAVKSIAQIIERLPRGG